MVVITTKGLPVTPRVVTHLSHSSHECVTPLHLQALMPTGPWLIPQTTTQRAETSQNSVYAYRDGVGTLGLNVHGVEHVWAHSCLHASKGAL